MLLAQRQAAHLTVAVRRDRMPYDLAGMTAHLVWQAADGKLVGPVPMEVADTASGTVRCTLPDACYAAVGMARAYIELRRGAELVDTTDEMLIEVLDCIDADGEQAEEYKPLIAEVREAVASAKRAAEGADAAASHQPRIGESDTWEVWDIASAQYVDTGVAARGAQGIQGEPGKDGAPGSDAAATEVRINGTSITADGVADIPMASNLAYGVIKATSQFGIAMGTSGNIYIVTPSVNEINSRSSSYKPITPIDLDYAVKAAMCDGKGAAWTAAEQAAAKKRMGIGAASAPHIWACLPDYTVTERDDYGGYGFEASWLEPIYPDCNATIPGDDDILFHARCIYTGVINSDKDSVSFEKRFALI